MKKYTTYIPYIVTIILLISSIIIDILNFNKVYSFHEFLASAVASIVFHIFLSMIIVFIPLGNIYIIIYFITTKLFKTNSHNVKIVLFVIVIVIVMAIWIRIFNFIFLSLNLELYNEFYSTIMVLIAFILFVIRLFIVKKHNRFDYIITGFIILLFFINSSCWSLAYGYFEGLMSV